jgi:VWFA-related protein
MSPVRWALVVSVACAFAASPAASGALPQAAVDQRARLVVVPVFATDSRRGQVDISQGDFRILEDGIPHPTADLLAPSSSPLELTLAVDVSASIESVLPELQLALTDLVGGLLETDVVQLFTFSEKFAELPRARTWPATFQALIPRGTSALYDGVMESILRVGTGPARRALVVFTDSVDENSRTSVSVLRDRVLTMDAAFFCVVLGSDRSIRAVRETFDDLAASTGGRVLSASAGQLRRAFEEIRTELEHLHVLSYRPLREAPDGRTHEIEVRAPERRDVRLRSRTDYIDRR